VRPRIVPKVTVRLPPPFVVKIAGFVKSVCPIILVETEEDLADSHALGFGDKKICVLPSSSDQEEVDGSIVKTLHTSPIVHVTAISPGGPDNENKGLIRTGVPGVFHLFQQTPLVHAEFRIALVIRGIFTRTRPESYTPIPDAIWSAFEEEPIEAHGSAGAILGLNSIRRI